MFDQLPHTVNVLIYVCVFLGVFLTYEGLQQLFFRRETQSEARNRRMRVVQRGGSTEDALKLLRDTALLGPEKKGGLYMRLRRLLLQAGVSVGPFWVFLCMGLIAVAAFFAAVRVLPAGPSGGLSVVLAVALPLFVLMQMKSERIKKLTTQLPDALDLMARGLKVGHPVTVTVGNVATNMPDPIGSEFGLIADQINFGDDLGTAFHDFAKRVATEDARYLAVAIGIQHGTGGNLSRILNVLSQVIRDRHNMRKKIKAISAEGRLSGFILTFLPVLIYFSIELTTPTFYGDVRGDPKFPYFALAIVGLVMAQGLILHRLVKFKF
ncbi:type II secretion system F family protein [Roseovarius aestuariivivens]|uniref:type II secretion system F family protein n=1 Tax=Roseovarius aestuariivivens TaxID=1888910 RepID=UPI0010811C53|nr:type II secretion system F family protein [Roseovarius aestuariivivens]